MLSQLREQFERGSPTHRFRSGISGQEALAGYLFITPAVLVFLVFVAAPMIAAFAFSLYKWDVFRAATFLGLDNYVRLFNDKRFFVTFWNTIVYALIEVPLNLIVALVIAMLINRRIHPALRYFFRTTYFFPVIISFVAVSILWRYLLIGDPTFGLVKLLSGQIGHSGHPLDLQLALGAAYRCAGQCLENLWFQPDHLPGRATEHPANFL